MSAKTTGIIWDMVLPAAQRMVLLAMVDHADHKGEHINAAIPYIAWKTGYSARNVARIVQDLIDSGLLIVTKAELGESNEYKFDFTHAKLKDEYHGRKPRKPTPTHDKMSGVKRRTHDKMSGVSSRAGPTHANLSPPHANMAWDTHDKMAIDHDPYHIESDPDLQPPPTTNHQPPGGGGDGARTRTIEQSPLELPLDPSPDAPTESELLLLQFRPEPFSNAAAFEFRDLPPDVVRSELAAAKLNGTGPGALVLRWRRVRPTVTTGDEYEYISEQATGPTTPRRYGAGAGRRSSATRDRYHAPVVDPERDADHERELAEFERLAAEHEL